MKKQYITPTLKLHLLKIEPLMNISKTSIQGTTPEVTQELEEMYEKTEEDVYGTGING